MQEALDALRDAGHEQLPRGPAHVTLGEFTCASAEESLGRCQSGALMHSSDGIIVPRSSKHGTELEVS